MSVNLSGNECNNCGSYNCGYICLECHEAAIAQARQEGYKLGVDHQNELNKQDIAQAIQSERQRIRGVIVDSLYGHRNYCREAPQNVDWKEFLFSTLDHIENDLLSEIGGE